MPQVIKRKDMTQTNSVTVYTNEETIGTFQLSSVPRKGDLVDHEWTRFKVVAVRTHLDENHYFVKVREPRWYDRWI